MKLIVCIDDKDGMAFGGRRQSKDRILRERMLELIENTTLWMHPYSAMQFETQRENLRVDEDFLEMAGQADYCFAETEDVAPYLVSADTVVLFRWNRTYPADLYFPVHLLADWNLASRQDFPGNSHDRITQEVYVR